MFIQVVRSKAKDPAGLKAAMEKWQTDVKPVAKGFVGATAGVADDGTHVAVVRFESEETARANSDLPEQSAWFKEVSKLMDGEPTFYDCSDVTLFMGGGSDDAGFVQVMVYKPTDLEKLKELNEKVDPADMGRTDIIGGTSAVANDGTVIDTTYFKSETEAREGEKKEMPAEMQTAMKEWGEVIGNVEYIDLRDPWLYSA
ncbi:MAG: hypothetical protein WD646_07150 [Actinomycetota bacterium]